MDLVKNNGPTKPFSKAIIAMGKNTDMADLSGLMAASLKVILSTIKWKVMVFTTGSMVGFTMENGSIINNMVKVASLGPMEEFMKEATSKINAKVKVFSHGKSNHFYQK